MEALYGPLILWAIEHWQNPGHTLHLALDTTMLWNRFCVVDAAACLMAWLPIPIQELEPCIPSRKARRRQAQAWFSTVEMPPRLRSADHASVMAVT